MPKTVLVADDNEKNRKLLRDVLQHRGYRTVEAETGEEGIELARARHPALVLMDIQLPGINGIEALRRLVELQPEIRGLIMTDWSRAAE